MDIQFKSRKLEKQLSQDKEMQKAYGSNRSKHLRRVMVSLSAAPNLGIFAPPYSPPNRCHELTDNRKGTISIDLDGPYRLLFEPINDPLPTLPDGGLDWGGVTAIKILGVEDTHG